MNIFPLFPFISRHYLILVMCSFGFPITGMTQTVRDYRTFQSPVKKQVNRGTCAAFGLLSAMETLPGFPLDLSEQYVYAQMKFNHLEDYNKFGEGSRLKYYAMLLEKEGTVREDLAPYHPNAPMWREQVSDFDIMKKDPEGSPLSNLLNPPDYTYRLPDTKYEYRDFDNARNVDWIKQKLDEGFPSIPVSYRVNDKYWSKHTGTAKQKIDLDDFVLVKQQNKFYPYSVAKSKIPGLTEKILKNQVETGFSDTSLIPNDSHTVCIVGYDANGFLIKNTWGEDWGAKGYGWISFDYHRLLAIEALLIISGAVDGDQTKEPLSVIPGDIWLKSCPLFIKANANEGTLDHSLMGFSITYHGAGMIPRFEKIEYKIYDDYAKLIETNTVIINKNNQETYDGYEKFVLEKNNTDPGKKFTVVITFTPVLQRPFTNTYELVEKVTKEYRARN